MQRLPRPEEQLPITFEDLNLRIGQLEKAIAASRQRYREVRAAYDQVQAELEQGTEDAGGEQESGKKRAALERRRARLDVHRGEVTAEGQRLRRMIGSLMNHRDAALAALRRSSPQEYEVVKSVVVDGQTQLEVAQCVGRSQSAVSRRLRRGLAFLDAFVTGGKELEIGRPSLDTIARVAGLTRQELLQRLVKEMPLADLARALGIEPDVFEWSLRMAEAKPDVLRALQHAVLQGEDSIEDLTDSSDEIVEWMAQSIPELPKEAHRHLGLLIAREQNKWTLNLLLWDEDIHGDPYDLLMIEGREEHRFETVDQTLEHVRSLMEYEGDVIGRYIGEQEEEKGTSPELSDTDRSELQ